MAVKQKTLDGRMAHLEKYRELASVQSVIAGRSTFVAQVEDFYGIRVHWRTGRGMPTQEFYTQPEEPSKRGQTPTDLVGILDGFGDEPLEREKLSYEGVRDDYKRWHAPKRILGEYVVQVATGIGMIVGGCAVLYAVDKGNVGWAIVSGIEGLGCFVGWFAFGSSYRPPRGSHGEFGEFLGLDRRAGNADTFVRERYRAKAAATR